MTKKTESALDNYFRIFGEHEHGMFKEAIAELAQLRAELLEAKKIGTQLMHYAREVTMVYDGNRRTGKPVVDAEGKMLKELDRLSGDFATFLKAHLDEGEKK